jgi:RNA polymerase sigma-70 factor (ECF subfamily)
MDDDILLVECINRGEIFKFNTIINKYHKRILNYFYRWTFNKEDAEDLTQELFARIFSNLKNYNKEFKFSTWLYKIAYNLAIDFKRKNKNTPTLSFNGDSKEEKIILKQTENRDSITEIENVIEKEEIYKKIKNALLTLPENQRMAIILKIYEEKNYSEISEIMDISKSAVESLLFRARDNLKKILKF